MTHAFTLNTFPLQRVHFGKCVREALNAEIDQIGARRVFIATSKTLRNETSALSLIASTLGNKCIAIFDSIIEHSTLDSAFQALLAAKSTRADLLVGVGGGSIVDALKIVQLGLAEKTHTIDDLLSLSHSRSTSEHLIRQIAIPTTLSGAEATAAASGTDSSRGVKLGFINPNLAPCAIIYDPALGALTPEWLWRSSAICGLDHCCEGFLARNCSPIAEAGLLHGLRLFASSLRRTKLVPGDPFARAESQMASYVASANAFKAGFGASHGIGYILGARYGLHHGDASCIMLPHVLKWNEKETHIRQRQLSIAMNRPLMSASEAVSELVSDLELPSRLRDKGITHPQLTTIAKEAATHPVVLTNPRPIQSYEDVLQILEAAW